MRAEARGLFAARIAALVNSIYEVPARHDCPIAPQAKLRHAIPACLATRLPPPEPTGRTVEACLATRLPPKCVFGLAAYGRQSQDGIAIIVAKSPRRTTGIPSRGNKARTTESKPPSFAKLETSTR